MEASHARARLGNAVLTVKDGWSVLHPAGSDTSADALFAYCKEHREALRAAVFSENPLLVRGWDLSHVSHAEHLIFEALGLGKMEIYPRWFISFNERCERLGVAPGGLVQKRLSRNAPDAAPRTMQPPHVEFGLGPHRPRVASFFCEVPPAADGETALFSFPRALELLDPELRRLLHTHGWWTSRSGTVQPATLRHPETGLEGLQLYAFSHGLTALCLDAYQRARAAERPDLPLVDRIVYSGPDSEGLTLVTGDGRKVPLGERRTVQLYRAMFGATRLHTWRQGDVLLFDNVLFGHARMPGRQPRLLHAIFAEEMDTRALRPASAPACVHSAAARKSKGAVAITLSQLGPGGWWIILATVMLFPDWCFQIFGRLLWAVNTSGNRKLGYAS